MNLFCSGELEDMKTLMENSPGLEKPTPLPPSPWVLWHGAPVCVRSQCANTQGSPAAEALLTNCSRSPACRKETAHSSRQHLKARTCSPLRKNVFYRRDVSSERGKGMEEKLSNAGRTEPLRLDMTTLNAQSPPCRMLRQLVAFLP